MSDVVFGQFEWDSAKADANVEKHGVSFVEAVSALVDVNAVEFMDNAIEADRVLTLGMSNAARVLLVVSVERGARTRIISARKATNNERKLYAEG